jgi:hypothetical protein
METFVHLEAFHDHLRLEEMLLDGRPAFEDGYFVPDRSQPGHGLTLREADAQRYEV